MSTKIRAIADGLGSSAFIILYFCKQAKDMAFYDLDKAERTQLVDRINYELKESSTKEERTNWEKYFANDDTYIRKTAYLTVGKLYKTQVGLKPHILRKLTFLYTSKDAKVRQTAINAAGEIGMLDFEPIVHFDGTRFV